VEIEIRDVGPEDDDAQRMVAALRAEVTERRARSDGRTGGRPIGELLAGDDVILVAFAGQDAAGLATAAG
jgi:hypothetical protein